MFDLDVPTLFGKDFKTGGGGEMLRQCFSKRLPASQRMVELTKQLAERTGELGERELITLKYMIARQKFLTIICCQQQIRKLVLIKPLSNSAVEFSLLTKRSVCKR